MLTRTLFLAIATLFVTPATKGSAMTYQVEVKDVSAQPALVIKGKVKIDQIESTINGIMTRIGAHLGKLGLAPTGAPFTRTYNFKDGVMEFEAGFPVAAGAKGEGDIIRTELPKTKVVVTTHIGPQATSEDAYKALHAWMTKHGKTQAGAPWEIYLSEPGTAEKDEKMRIFYPIR